MVTNKISSEMGEACRFFSPNKQEKRKQEKKKPKKL